jgi:predicted DNA-binding WGR domain protein
MYVRLESVKPGENRYRRYVVSVSLTLWGTYGVRCEWGRIGERMPRGARLRECADQDEALRLAAEVIELRLRHGYSVRSRN